MERVEENLGATGSLTNPQCNFFLIHRFLTLNITKIQYETRRCPACMWTSTLNGASVNGGHSVIRSESSKFTDVTKNTLIEATEFSRYGLSCYRQTFYFSHNQRNDIPFLSYEHNIYYYCPRETNVKIQPVTFI